MALHIYGIIGDWYDGLDTASIKNALGEEEDEGPVDVYINSPGGDVFAGIAIMSILARHKGKVTAHIDGLAASAATIVMLGADEVVVPSNAMVMIHNPWMMAAGDYRDMAKASEDLEKIRDSMLAAYKDKTGKGEEELKALLDGETWMTAQEAVDHGFADRVGGSVAEASLQQRLGTIDFKKFERAPEEFAAVAKIGRRKIAAMAASKQGAESMPKKTEDNQGPAVAPQTLDAPSNVVARESQVDNPVDLDSVRAEGTQAVTGLYGKVNALCDRVNLAPGSALKILGKVGSGKVTTMEAAQDLVIDAQANNSPTPNYTGINGAITMGEDSQDKFKTAATTAILSKGGIKGHKTDGQNPYFGMTLHRLAEESIKASGGRPDYSSRESLVKQALNVKAFGGHSRSDFPEILKDSVEKSALSGHEDAEETWDRWTRTKSLNSFREAPMVSLSAFDALKEVSENGEYTRGSVSERGERIQLAKYGKILQISYEMIIDDDLDQLTDAPRLMGLMAAQIPGDLAYGVLTDNPTMNQDSTALFHADHSNTANTVLGYNGLDEANQNMRLQVFKSPDGSERRLNIRPEFLIVPPQLERTAKELMASEVVGFSNQTNTFRDSFTTIVENRLGDAAAKWYLAANGRVTDTVVVAFLNGNPAPFVDQKENWDVDALEFKIRLECAAAASGCRGLQRGGDGT